jgi:urease accessory protein
MATTVMNTTTAMDTGTSTEISVGSPAAFLGALRLGSAALPIGAFAYSQALEQAVAIGAVTDRHSAARWIEGMLEHSLLGLDVPVLSRIFRSLASNRLDDVDRWSDFLYASRPTQELRAEERQLGRSLFRWLDRQAEACAARHLERGKPTLAAAFAVAARSLGLSHEAAALTYAFAWCEAQVGAATRLIPLGQSDAQLVLSGAIARLDAGFQRSLALEDDELAATAPGQALLSAAHETQYSRLFRS